MMKAQRLPFFLTAFALLLALGSQAQTASTICLDEAKAAFAQVDVATQTQQDSVIFVQWTLTAKLRERPGIPPVISKESMLMTRDLAIYTTPDATLHSDRTEAFNHQLNQRTLYRVKPEISKMAVMQGIDAGIFEFATVHYCGFYRAEMPDEKTWKERYIRLSLEGQRKYNVAGMRFITDPIDGTLKLIRIEYTGTSLYTEAEYRFTQVDLHHKPVGGVKKLTEYFLQPDGKLLPEYGTTKLMDYRR